MREKLKKIPVIFAVAACVLGLSACSSSSSRLSGDPVDEATQQTLISYGETYVSLIQQVVDAGQEDLFEAQYPDEASVFKAAFESFSSAERDLGTINGFIPEDEYAVYTDTEEVTVNIGIDGTDHDADVQIVMPVTIAGGQVQSVDNPTGITTNVRYSMGELMGQAGMNTLLGMGTTFAVLIILALLISLFKYIPKIQAAMSKKNKAPEEEEEAPAPAAPAPAAAVEEELTDDGELVAVIAAAIAASEGHTTTDGFVVRSIRKARKRF